MSKWADIRKAIKPTDPVLISCMQFGVEISRLLPTQLGNLLRRPAKPALLQQLHHAATTHLD
jgi:hypothetical protein